MKVIRGEEISFIPASHEDQDRPGVLKRVLAVRDDLQPGKIQMVNWARLPARASFQPHYHEDMQEMFIMLGGPVFMVVNGESFELNAGDAILIDPTEVHQMQSQSDAEIEYLVFGVSSEQGGKTIVVDS